MSEFIEYFHTPAITQYKDTCSNYDVINDDEDKTILTDLLSSIILNTEVTENHSLMEYIDIFGIEEYDSFLSNITDYELPLETFPYNYYDSIYGTISRFVKL